MAKDDSSKTFSFDTVALLVAILKENKITLGMKHYHGMAAMDPSGKSASSYDHQFRPVKARAEQLIAGNAGSAVPNTPTPKKGKGTKAGSVNSSAKKRKNAEVNEDEEPNNLGQAEDEVIGKAKKIKKEETDEDQNGVNIFEDSAYSGLI